MAKYTENGAEVYRKVHWGYKANRSVPVEVPGLSKDHPVIEMGLLTELHIDPLPGVKVPRVRVRGMTDEAAEKPDMEYLGEIAISPDDYNNNHLVFDPRHPRHRLYLVLSPSSRRDAREHLWKPGAPTCTLFDLAGDVGGHHADKNDYPDVQVQPLGLLYYVTYYTLKEEENGEPSPAKYIHRMGEEHGVEPVLAVDKDGNLYIAGGTYTCEVAGITR